MQQNPLQHHEALPAAEAADTFTRPQDLTGAEAEASLSQEQGESLETIGTALSQEAQQFRRTGIRSVAGLSVFGALMIAGKSLFGEDRWYTLLTPQVACSVLLSIGLILSLAMVTSASKPRKRRRALTAQVAEQDDIRAIGPLIDALHLDDAMTREVAIDALTKLLPRLQASDAALLNTSQRAKLCFLLSLPMESPLYKDLRAIFHPADSRAVAFRIAILRAFKQIGDSKALSIVKQVAAWDPKTQGEKEVKETAVACLPAMQKRIEQVKSSQTLLRASHPSAAASDTLLRAATGNQEVAPGELLRASEPGS